MFQNIIVEEKAQIAYITISRPEFLNALNAETIKELNEAFVQLEGSNQCGVIILTGAGEKSFVAGADIKEFMGFNIQQGGELAFNGQQTLFDVIENLSIPVIAAINGFALGGGLELAMACHMRIASDNVKLGLPEVSLGVIPGYGGTQRLPQLVGKGKANQMILSADMITAADALIWGLVNEVVPQSDLIETCEKLANRILRNAPTAIAAAIKCVNAGFEEGVNGYHVEIEAFGKCFGTSDFKKGTEAFVNKQKATFR